MRSSRSPKSANHTAHKYSSAKASCIRRDVCNEQRAMSRAERCTSETLLRDRPRCAESRLHDDHRGDRGRTLAIEKGAQPAVKRPLLEWCERHAVIREIKAAAV